MSDLPFEFKEVRQENHILNEIMQMLIRKLKDAEIDNSELKFESHNAILLKQHLLGIFSFYSDIIKKLNLAIAKDKINREFAQEENTLFEIVQLLSENVKYLEKINKKLEQKDTVNSDYVSDT